MSDSANGQLRRRLLITAIVATVFGGLHHLDHIIRGNHVGWPLVSEVTPFTFSFLIYPIILPGLYLTVRRSVWAGFWAVVAMLGLLLVGSTHLGPQAVEPIQDVYTPHANPFVGAAAVAILFGLVISLGAALVTAIQVRAISGRW